MPYLDILKVLDQSTCSHALYIYLKTVLFIANSTTKHSLAVYIR